MKKKSKAKSHCENLCFPKAEAENTVELVGEFIKPFDYIISHEDG